ncbi:MAG: response regulator [Burkholderiaceae bacterium]
MNMISSEPVPATLMLVDDHNLFRRGLRALFAEDDRLRVICEAADMGEALRCLEQHRPDVILLDNHLPGVRGVDGIGALKDASPASHILMLTVSEEEDDLVAALRAGADGYLLKTMESEQLVDTIFRVLAGDSVISPEMLTKLVSVFRAQGAPSREVALPASAPAGRARPADRAPSPDGMRSSGGAGAADAANKEKSAAVAPVMAASAGRPIDTLSPREREILILIARGDSNKLIARELDIAETTVKIHVQHILRKLDMSSRVQAAVYATSQGLI